MEIEEKKGWSWLGFLFMPYYYAGYGALQKGIIFAILAGFMAGIDPELMSNVIVLIILLVIGLGIAIYGGVNAKKELPVGKQKFSWKNVILALVVYIISMSISSVLFLSFSEKTPKCNDVETRTLVIEITKEELSKQGLESILSEFILTVEDIRTSSYNKDIGKYECVANLIMKNNSQQKSVPISYTSQVSDDSNSFYVEVFGL